MILKLLNLFLTTINLQSLHYYDINPQEVIVSYYSQGQITANGETYIPDNLTCASPNLPFNTKIICKGIEGIVKIRVNDRGPFNMRSTGEVIYPLEPHPSRVLDLSRESYLRVFGELESGINTLVILEVEFPNE